MARLILLAVVAYYLSFIIGPIFIEPILAIMGFNRGSLRSDFGIEAQVLETVYRVVLTLMTWVVMAYAYIPLGFIRPRVAQFSDTKPLRYAQSVFAFCICGVIAVPIVWMVVLFVAAANDIQSSDFETVAIMGTTGAAFIFGGGFVMSVFGALVDSPIFPPIIRFLDQSRFGYGGAGRFTGLLEESRQTFEGTMGEALFLGRSLFWPFLKVGLKDDRHMLTIAGSRGGKGVSAIIPNLLTWRGSAVVIDPKGTNTAVTANFRGQKFGQTVHVIDPFGITSHDNIAFNPLQQFRADAPDARERILLIADALVMSDGKERDPHWNDTARQVLAGYVAHLMTDPSYARRRNLPELRTMLRLSGEDRLHLLADMCVNDAAGELAMDVGNRIINMGESAELKSILSSVEKHTEWLSSPTIAKSLSAENSFKFSDAKDRKTTIYLVIPPQYLKTHARFIRLFINLTIRGFVDGGKAEIPTLLMMDEFLSLGHMAEVENAMSWTAGYNLFLWPFIQDFGSFKELYGTKVNAFLGNSRAVQVFAVDDEETNKFVSERLGKKPLTARLEISRSNETLPIREPSEVALDISAESGRQYILQAGKPTMLLERMPYFKSLMFKDYDPDPDHPKAVEAWQKMW